MARWRCGLPDPYGPTGRQGQSTPCSTQRQRLVRTQHNPPGSEGVPMALAPSRSLPPRCIGLDGNCRFRKRCHYQRQRRAFGICRRCGNRDAVSRAQQHKATVFRPHRRDGRTPCVNVAHPARAKHDATHKRRDQQPVIVKPQRSPGGDKVGKAPVHDPPLQPKTVTRHGFGKRAGGGGMPFPQQALPVASNVTACQGSL